MVTRDVARSGLELYEVDELGLDRLDRAVIEVLCRRFGGGPVGVSTLAVAVGEERETVEEVAEPFLVRIGFLARTPRGRVATPAAWRHLGLAARRRRRRRGDALRGVIRRRAIGDAVTCRTRGYTSPLVGRSRVTGIPCTPCEEVCCRVGAASLLPLLAIAVLFWA